jgi:tetratricopeptide (TPR) repeat protein
MMTEAGFLRRIQARLRRGRKQNRQVLELAKRAVDAYPKSAWLLIVFGELIEMITQDDEYESFNPPKLYRRAIRYEPNYWEGYEAAGFYQFVYGGKYGNLRSLKKSEDLFRRAIRLGAGNDSFLGLGGVLLEQGRHSAARRALNKCTRRNDSWLKNLLRDLDGPNDLSGANCPRGRRRRAM